MAWIAVRTSDGDELASWEVDGPCRGLTIEQAFPGLSAAVEHALERDRSLPRVDIDCICPHRTEARPYTHLAMCPVGRIGSESMAVDDREITLTFDELDRRLRDAYTTGRFHAENGHDDPAWVYPVLAIRPPTDLREGRRETSR